MNTLLVNILLALAWTLVTEWFAPANFIIGFLVGYVILLLGKRVFGGGAYFEKAPRIISFLAWFIWQIIAANLRMAYYTLMPLGRMKPGVVAVPLEPMTDAEISILTNLITLTPGTLALDISDDHRVLYVHAMDAGDHDGFVYSIKEGFERRLLEITR